MMEIRDEFFEYVHKELGFSKRKINKAWKLAQKDFPLYDSFTIEVLTRDILQNRNMYNETKERMKTGGRLKSY